MIGGILSTKQLLFSHDPHQYQVQDLAVVAEVGLPHHHLSFHLVFFALKYLKISCAWGTTYALGQNYAKFKSVEYLSGILTQLPCTHIASDQNGVHF